MSTYYMKGTISPEKSIELFEMLLFPINTIVDIDNDMENELKKHITNNKNDISNDYSVNTKELNNIYKKNLKYLSELINNFDRINDNITVYEFTDSYKKTVEIFQKHYLEFYSNIIIIIEKDNINDKEESYFNNYYNKYNKEINNSINKFYKNAEKFAEKFDIDFN